MPSFHPIKNVHQVSSVIRQKRANLKTGVSRKQSTPKFPKNKHFLPHTYVCVSGGKKCLFFGNFGVLCFLETPVLRFALLPYSRRYVFDLITLFLTFVLRRILSLQLAKLKGLVLEILSYCVLFKFLVEISVHKQELPFC